jgi:hypothetical protein
MESDYGNTEEDRKQKWDDALKHTKWMLVTKRMFAVVVTFLIVFLLAACSMGVYYLYLVQQGKLTPTVDIAPIFNPNVNVDNPVEVNNDYEFPIETDNDYKIEVYVDLGDMICYKKEDGNES